MSRTTIKRIAVVAIFAMAMATSVTSPAQAKFGAFAGYKYIFIPDDKIKYGAHVFQLDILSTLGNDYRTSGKRPRHALGVALTAGGGGHATIASSTDSSTESSTDSPADTVYFAIPFVYEYVFPLGVGISAGVSIPFYVAIGSGEGGSSFLTGITISDLGLNYHFKSGLALYARGNVGTATAVLGNIDGTFLAWGIGLGGGYWF